MKIKFITTILKFKEKGEKTGWTYIDIPADVARRVKPGTRQSFRVKGMLDDTRINGIALLPMGGGDFIMPLNAVMRKSLGKRHGAMLKVELEEDKTPVKLDEELLICLEDEPAALRFFRELSKSQQNYFSKWVAEARTGDTKAKRIAQSIQGLLHRQNFPEMIRSLKKT